MTAPVVFTQTGFNSSGFSSSVAIPATNPDTGQPYTQINAATALLQSDAADPAKTCAIRLYFLPGGVNPKTGQPWQDVIGNYVTNDGWGNLGWTGNPLPLGKGNTFIGPGVGVNIPLMDDGTGTGNLVQPAKAMAFVDTLGSTFQTFTVSITIK